MQPRNETTDQADKPDHLPHEFRADGSCHKHGDPNCTKLVGYLVRRRRESRMSPAEFAYHIGKPEHVRYHRMFPSRHQWLELDGWVDWPSARMATSAEATVRYCGRSQLDHGWAGGEWLPEAFIERRDRSGDLRELFREEAAHGNQFAIAYLAAYGDYREGP